MGVLWVEKLYTMIGSPMDSGLHRDSFPVGRYFVAAVSCQPEEAVYIFSQKVYFLGFFVALGLCGPVELVSVSHCEG